MDDEAYNLLITSLVGGCIRGMSETGQGLTAENPATYPPISDGDMFDAAVLLLAILIEANPDFRDAKQFGKGAELVRSEVRARLNDVWRQSEALGTPVLYKYIEAATGSGPILNDR